jgi:hypothetical protein
VNLTLGILLVLRYIEYERLKKVLKVIKKRDNICNTGSIYLLITEILFALVQPYPFLMDVIIKTDKEWYLKLVQYELNTLLLIPVLLRSYVIYRFLISITPFYNARADRVSKMFGGYLTRLFAIKCLLIEYPFQILAFFTASSAVLIAYLIRIVEYTDELMENNEQAKLLKFKYLGDTLWYVVITYATIGYGDYCPKTNLGRIFGIIASLLGTYLTSIMVICLQHRYNLKDIEEQVLLL